VKRTGGVSRHTDDVHLAGRKLQEEQHVDRFEKHRVDGEEVARQNRLRLGGQELLPGRSRSARRGVDAGLVQDLAYRAGGDLVVRLPPTIPQSG
jgi:hypothetical protein